ncbi:MAG: M20/M25/M40 family metallo-hydrolase [Chloroflexi bacterium]|jgi:acetylornithine deacetylase/succinyl-diaminopimelate desuccinylase-like protein|nr:M20/M25/M40 family metallo-hydrolase [Chloroflexota bacterium]
MQEVYDYIEEHWLEAIDDLKRYCAQPSISAQAIGMDEAAALTAELLREYGIESRVLPTAGKYPVVYGELQGDSPYSLLFYNHYDVQPPEPLELWTAPPFEPTIDGGMLKARGTSDDKGDIIARLLAIKAFLKTRGRLPISVKFLIEGEEEVGSPNLPAFIEENRALLKSDACYWEGGRVSWEDRPEIILGLKGIIGVELEARGAVRDLHSSIGTIVPNAAWRLVWALNTLKDADEKIMIDGFYDDVRPPTEDEAEAIKVLPSDETELRQSLEIEGFLKGLTGVDLNMYSILQPACNINGLISGYTGEGSKTVLPSHAKAKLDFRLVPDQRPDDIISKLRKHLDKHGFADVALSAVEGESPTRTPLDSPFVKIVSEAAREVYGAEPIVKPSMTGSGPMFSFTNTLGLPVASSGVSNPDSRPHAPDENIRLADFLMAAKYVAAIMDRCAQ